MHYVPEHGRYGEHTCGERIPPLGLMWGGIEYLSVRIRPHAHNLGGQTAILAGWACRSR